MDKGRPCSAASDRYTLRTVKGHRWRHQKNTKSNARRGEAESWKSSRCPSCIYPTGIYQICHTIPGTVAQVRGEERENPNYTVNNGSRETCHNTSDRCRAFELGTSLIPPPGRSLSLPVSTSELSVDGRFHRLMLSSRSSSRSPGG